MAHFRPTERGLSLANSLDRFDRSHVDLFTISFLSLFLELACIRWFGSTVVFLTFFTNLVLMACFLGISVGCLAARSRRDIIVTVIPLAFCTMSLAFGLLWSYVRFGDVMIDVGSQASPEQIYLGTEFRAHDLSAFVVPLEVIAGVFFVLISLIFIGVGQTMGRAFNAIANPVEAYTINLIGSLAGIAGFGVASYLRTPPSVWFSLIAALVVYFIKRPSQRWVAAAASVLLVAGLVLTTDLPDLGKGNGGFTIWSPYYKIHFEPGTRALFVNNIQHQVMVDITKDRPFYRVPYLMNRAAGRPDFDDVLIIGAGSGNDVATALAEGVKHVDAVEIDPALDEIGRRYHPNYHGGDPRVSTHIDDGRSFMRSTRRKYDLIVYALVDSLVLHSGYSSIRLESFLFTEQAFRDLKEHLKPGGVLVIYNYYRQGWVVGRLAKLQKLVFGTEPVVLSLPHQAAITATENQGNRLTFLIAGSEPSPAIEAIRAKLRENQFFWLHRRPTANGLVNAYRPTLPYKAGPRPTQWYKLGPAQVETEGIGRYPTDDYPFLYLRDAGIPSLNLRGMFIVGVLSLAVLFAFAPCAGQAQRPDVLSGRGLHAA